MDRTTKRHLKDIEKHVPYDEMKSRKQAGKLRRALRGKEKGEVRESRITEDNWEELLDKHGPSRKRPSIETMLAHLQETQSQEVETDDADWDEAGIVMSVSSGRCRVFFEGQEVDCLVPPELAVRQRSSLAVGDRVRVTDDDGVWRLASVLPRHSVLARPDPLHAHLQRLIAANIDVVIHVVSVKAPPLRPRLIDRYLIAIQRGGAQPVICVNKLDLLSPADRAHELDRLAPYRDLGVPVIACSSKTGEGLEELRAVAEGKMAALVGHSGVGKSSILNALDASLQLATNTLHKKRGTGRHTTTASTLFDFGSGTYLIDTPGIREFGLWDLDRESLRDYFPEFAEHAELCRFTNCTHVHEPDCEVQDRVEDETLDRGRYETYVRLWEDLR
ncbi:MAG: ribosome small subunit-dependent GTPase A [Acidobacteria bacterium]|nr:ribosome small subunit-dependent GTPase A [Acidobacteriota bacterium]MBV9476917.1 ribosome small subunit-dependent GTPase A [Acidobacteriota bacterium]